VFEQRQTARQLVYEQHKPLRRGSAARLAWHATACGSLGALRPRLSPGLPLSRSLEGVRSCRTAVVLLPSNETAARNSEACRVAGGRADMTTTGRRSPLSSAPPPFGGFA